MSGPASLVHLSKLLDRFHFANNEKFIDSRIGKLYKYARTLDAPERRTMSFVGNFVADRFTTRLVEAGITPKYSNELGKKGKLVAFEVNPSSEAGRQVLEEARARGITVSH
jgi:ferritin